MNKRWRVTLQNLPNLIRYLEGLDFHRQWDVTIAEAKSTRSLEQNDRLWKLYRSIGDFLGYTPDDVHDLMGYKFLRELKTINGNNIEVIKSTTQLKTNEMAKYQQSIEFWASQMGWGGLDE